MGYFEYSKNYYNPMNTKKTKFHEHVRVCNFMKSGIFTELRILQITSFPKSYKRKERKSLYIIEKLETFQLLSDQHKNQ